jgi:DNA-binding NarL/FixJ family response regulator
MSDVAAREDASNKSDVTVVVADDQVAMRAGVRRALEPHGMRIVAEASTAEEAVQAALASSPDVCVIDVQLPGDGIEAARRIREALPQVKIVMLTASERQDDLFSALRAGADGYLLKTTSPDRLPFALRGVVRGEAALPRALTKLLISEFRDRGRSRRVPLSMSGQGVELTSREFEVLERLRKGEPTSEIASRLAISEVTVRRHISGILHKLGTPDRRSALELLERAERGPEELAGV